MDRPGADDGGWQRGQAGPRVSAGSGVRRNEARADNVLAVGRLGCGRWLGFLLETSFQTSAGLAPGFDTEFRELHKCGRCLRYRWFHCFKRWPLHAGFRCCLV